MNKNIYKMSHRERRHLRIDELPGNLSEALDELEKDDLVRDTLGEHMFEHFVDGQARGVARLHQARLAVGGRSVPRRLLDSDRRPAAVSALAPHCSRRRFHASRARARDLM